MKKLGERKLFILGAVGVCLVIFVFVTYLIPEDPFSRAKIYTENQGSFAFQLPDSFGVEREEIAEDEVYIKVTAPNDSSVSNPGLMNITVFEKNTDMTLLEHASSFLEVESDELVSVPSTKEGFYYTAVNGQDAVHYYFFENQSNIIVFRFNKTYFDKSNPMMLVNNSAYANVFLRSLNSVTFY